MQFETASAVTFLPKNFASLLAEVRYLCLFYDRPYVVGSDLLFGYLDEEVIHAARSGSEIKNCGFEEDGDVFENSQLLATDAWDELVESCRFLPRKIVIETSDHPTEDPLLLEISDAFPELGDEQKPKEMAADRDFESEIVLIAKRNALAQIVGTVREINDPTLSIFWGDEVQRGFADQAYMELLTRTQNSGSTSGDHLLRRVFAEKVLMQAIAHLPAFNLSRISLQDVCKFRQGNQDLVDKFLVSMREFRSEVIENPSEFQAISEKFKLSLHRDWIQISDEIIAVSARRKSLWIRMAGEGFQATASNFLSLGDVVGLVSHAAGITGRIAGMAAGARAEKIEGAEQVLRSSASGYLWKINTDLR